MLSIFSIRLLGILIMIILNSLSHDNGSEIGRIPAISESGSDACSISSNCGGFCPLVCLAIFWLKVRHDVLGKGAAVRRSILTSGKVWWEGKCSVVQWLALSLLVSLCFWVVTFTSAYQFPPLQGGLGWLDGAEVGYFPSPKSLRL